MDLSVYLLAEAEVDNKKKGLARRAQWTKDMVGQPVLAGRFHVFYTDTESVVVPCMLNRQGCCQMFGWMKVHRPHMESTLVAETLDATLAMCCTTKAPGPVWHELTAVLRNKNAQEYLYVGVPVALCTSAKFMADLVGELSTSLVQNERLVVSSLHVNYMAYLSYRRQVCILSRYRALSDLTYRAYVGNYAPPIYSVIMFNGASTTTHNNLQYFDNVLNRQTLFEKAPEIDRKEMEEMLNKAFKEAPVEGPERLLEATPEDELAAKTLGLELNN